LSASNVNWESKYNNLEKEFKQIYEKLEKTNEKKMKDDAKNMQDKFEKEIKEKKSLASKETEKYNELKKQHETDVRELFENIGTLKFVKELRFFKKQWGE